MTSGTAHAKEHVSFEDLIDLACENVGGSAIFANDEFFAPKENLLKATTPIFIPDKYTENGKWMDGWESRRKRGPGHDWCVIRLGLAGVVHGVNVDTSHFTGNYPEYASIEACVADASAGEKELSSARWTTLVPKTKLQGGTQNLIPVSDRNRWTHLRLNIFPDGGVARLRVHGQAVPDWREIVRSGQSIDLAAAANGAVVVTCNDMFFGPKDNLIFPGRARHMGEGWETRRKRGPGHDWIIVRLARGGRIKKIEVDTNHFKGNYPDRCSIEACAWPSRDLVEADFRDRTDLPWKEILPQVKLQAHHQHLFEAELSTQALDEEYDYVRLNIYPDGGVSRLRVYGEINA